MSIQAEPRLFSDEIAEQRRRWPIVNEPRFIKSDQEGKINYVFPEDALFDSGGGWIKGRRDTLLSLYNRSGSVDFGVVADWSNLGRVTRDIGGQQNAGVQVITTPYRTYDVQNSAYAPAFNALRNKWEHIENELGKVIKLDFMAFSQWFNGHVSHLAWQDEMGTWWEPTALHRTTLSRRYGTREYARNGDEFVAMSYNSFLFSCRWPNYPRLIYVYTDQDENVSRHFSDKGLQNLGFRFINIDVLDKLCTAGKSSQEYWEGGE